MSQLVFRLGFTGSTIGPMEHNSPQMFCVQTLLTELFEPDAEFHHGKAIGWDNLAAYMARDIGYRLVGHPPVNTSMVPADPVRNDEEYPPEEYLARDRRIAVVTHKLVVAPHQDHEVLRSGTWATARYANSLGHPGYVAWPDGNFTLLSRAVGQVAARLRQQRQG